MERSFGWTADVGVNYPNNVKLFDGIYEAISNAMDGRAPIFGLARKAPRLIIKFGVDGANETGASEEAVEIVKAALGQTGLSGFSVETVRVESWAELENRIKDFEARFDFQTGQLRKDATILHFPGLPFDET